MAKPPKREKKPPAEQSTKLGVPGAPAGDVDAIIEQNRADRLAARRRAKLIEETRQGPDSELQPRDELSEDSVSKSVDDLLK
jgi:hypothetical protein